MLKVYKKAFIKKPAHKTQLVHGGKNTACYCSGSRKQTSLELLLGEVEMHTLCREELRGDWRSGTEHSAHLGHYQYHTGHRWGITLNPVAVSKRRV